MVNEKKTLITLNISYNILSKCILNTISNPKTKMEDISPEQYVAKTISTLVFVTHSLKIIDAKLAMKIKNNINNRVYFYT